MSSRENLSPIARDYDAILTDIIMPKINGVQAIQSIRRAFPLVRIVAISGGGNLGVGHA